MAVFVRPAGDLHDDLLFAAGVVEVTAPHIDILMDALVVRLDKGKVTGLDKRPDKGPVSPVEDPDDAPFLLPPLIPARHAGDDRVAVHGTQERRGRYKKIFAFRILFEGHDKTEAAGRDLYLSRHKPHGFREPVSPVPGLDQCPGAFQFLQSGPESLDFPAAQAELGKQRFRRHGSLGVGTHVFHDFSVDFLCAHDPPHTSSWHQLPQPQSRRAG